MATLRWIPHLRACVADWISALLMAAALGISNPAAGAENLESIVQESAPAQATGETTTYKFTPTYYSTSNERSAWDLNLRGNNGPHTWWTGWYRRHEEFQQLRLGYENSMELPFGRLVPSLQYATRGFLGGSATAEIGDRYFGLLGWGRTNLKDYYNLNFDPNDAVTFGLGTRALENTTLALFQVRDDRLGTGQRVTHLTARIKPDSKTRWTLDVFHKRGVSPDDGEIVQGTGLAVTYDFGRYFARIARDPYVNFSKNTMVRTALGFRF
jgi:hypothetical protein